MSAPPKLLGQSDCWCCWKLVDGKKPPYSARGDSPSGHSEEHSGEWADFGTASGNAEKHGLGVGFVFRKNRNLVFIDIDGCVKDRIVHSAALAWLGWFPTYAEISVSGSGLHIVCAGKIPKNLGPTPLAEGVTVEMYSHSRYMAYTGDRISEQADAEDCQIGLDKLWAAIGNGDPEPGPWAPMSKAYALKLHRENLAALRKAVHGQGNPLNNTVCFVAGKLRAAGVLDDTALDEIRKIVTEEWSKPISDREFERWSHGWSEGIEEPIEIREETEFERKAAEFNVKHAVVQNFGGKCRVIWFKKETHKAFKGRLTLVNQSFEEFNKAHNDTVTMEDEEGEPEEKRFVNLWLYTNGVRREYSEVVYEPECEAPGCLNLWQGWAVEPKKGDCQFYLDHLRDVICSGDETDYNFTLKWMAYAVQNPNEQGHSALVWRGQKGSGKNLAMDIFGKLWRQHYLVLSDPDLFLGRFNHHLWDCSVLCANEAFYAGNKRHEQILKSLITDPMLALEKKYVDLAMCPNLLHIVVISNADWVVPTTMGERRFHVPSVSPSKIGNKAYFNKLANFASQPNAALLWHLLHEVDLTDFMPHYVPETKGLQEQIARGLEDAEGAFFECLSRGELPGVVEDPDKTVLMASADFIEWARVRNRKWANINEEKIGLLFKNNSHHKLSLGFEKVRAKVQSNFFKEGARVWRIPTLASVRQSWPGWPTDPDKNEHWQEVPFDEWGRKTRDPGRRARK